MDTSPEKLRGLFSIVRVALASTLGVLLVGASVPRLPAQSSDFNSGSDTGWTRYELPAYGAPTFSFPADDSGGKAYKISAPPTGDDTYGLQNARAGSFRTDKVYNGRFSVGVDLLTWNANWRQEAGIVFNASNIGLGTTCGYSATYSSAYHNLYISALTSESPTTVAELGSGSLTLDPTHRYRLVASSHDGSTLLLQIFDKAEPDCPRASAIGLDASYPSGVCGLLIFEQTYPSATEGAEATFDNYLATEPTAGTLRATVTDLSPAPAGKSAAFYPTITVGILDRDTQVDANSILLSLDGVWIANSSLGIETLVHKPQNPSSGTQDFGGATVTYAITNLLPWGSHHTNSVAFRDSTSTWQTNTWTWTSAYAYLFASNSLPAGSLKVRGFDARTVQSANGGVTLANTLERALQQLAIPPAIPIDLAATSIVQTLSWDKAGTPASVPGLCAGSYINIAVESLAYLELTAGPHRFHIKTDDRAGLYSGVSLADTNAQALWENPGNTADSTFDFVVEAAGLYPVRCIWEETGGGAIMYLYSVNLDDSSEVLINDPSDTTGVVKAWYPIACYSAPSAAGPYTVDTAAVNVLNTADIVGTDCSPTVVGQMVTGGTFTVPISDTARFYHLDGPRATKITNFRKNASNVVITYQVL